MKKQFSKIIALSLVCAMLVPNVVFATNTNRPSLSGNSPDAAVSDNTTVSGNGLVDKAIYKVMLPSDLNFAVDSFQVAGNQQIYGANYPIVNTSEFPVRIDVSVSDNSEEGTLVEDADSEDLVTENAGKKFYLTAEVPESISVNSAISANDVSGNTLHATSTSDNSVFPVGEDEAAAFSFVLDRYTDNTISANNCAVFTFGGKVNPYEKWKDKDLAVVTTFKLVGLPAAAYAEADPDAGNNLTEGSGGSVSIFPKTVTVPVDSPLVLTITPPGSITNITSFTMPDAAAAGAPVEGIGGTFGGTYVASTGVLTIPVNFMNFFPTGTRATITYTKTTGVSATASIVVNK